MNIINEINKINIINISSEMNEMKKIKIVHKNWSDFAEINNNILKRDSDNKDSGRIILNERLLIIYWDKWEYEYFYKKNDMEYFLMNEENLYNIDISTISLVINNYEDLFLIDIKYKKVYKKKNIEFYGNINIINNLLIVEDENKKWKKTFVYFNFKYYELDYLNIEYDVYIINNIIYFFLKSNNIFYRNNIYEEGEYYKYNNKIKILFNGNEELYFYCKKEKIYKTYNPIIKNIKIDDFINKKNIYIINENNNLDYLIINIKYYNNFKINTIIFDNICNKNNNTIYDDLNIIYFNNINEINIDKIVNLSENLYVDKTSNPEYNINKDHLINLWLELNNDNIDNYSLLLNQQNDKISKIIHFIWIGNKVIPKEYINYINSWIENHTDYIFCFWNDNNIPKLINQKYYDEATMFAMKADILRYELLYFFGGIYIDCDFLCLKNIDNIIENYDGISGYESDEYIAIGILGFVKHDNILLHIMKELVYNIEEDDYKKLNKTIPELTGPIFFTSVWLKYKTEKHYAFNPEYFYSYTFNDKHDNKNYSVNENNYAIHMWGYSWNKKQKIEYNEEDYYLLHFYLSNLIYIYNNNNNNKYKIQYNNLSSYLKKNICFKINRDEKKKKKIVHIMGLFFTGGIERYLYYIDKYGDHEKYEYYLLYISNGEYVYHIQNMNMISFDWNHVFLNKALININPDLIIDHYSLYLQQNDDFYNKINRNIIIYFVHSAIIYNNDISRLKINNCIHLYNEVSKHISWNEIMNNNYVTLGTEFFISKKKKKKKKKTNVISISIIGRIAEEKIPILFFEKLCILSNEIIDKCEIHIYGKKDNIFNKLYVEKFELLIKDSKIILHDFVNPDEMYNIYLKTDILLIPSFYETGSFTCIEAFSYGIPVIARDVYGLKFLIKNNITGYLCDSDDYMLNKIRSISYKTDITKNYNIIKDTSLKYNIIDKINDLENIICKYTPVKNIIIITSVLNCVNESLSYYYTRSIFTLKERYKHTIETINSIKKRLPDIEILFCECSDLSNSKELEHNIKNNVDYYYNFYDIEIVRNNVNSKLKGLGEVYILLEGIEKLINLKKQYKHVFKISGRYFLNNNFDYKVFDNDKNIFTNWDNSNESYCTVFYKINMNDLYFYKYSLLNSINYLQNGCSIEQCIFKNFNKSINVIDKLNISGLLATEGYLFSV